MRAQRDRKAELVDAAARLFAEHGYHQVGIDEVAAAVGITGGAVYRHFRGKAALLAGVLFARLNSVVEAFDIESAAAEVDSARRLCLTIENLVAVGFEVRDFTILANRDARNLDVADRDQFECGVDAVAQRLAQLLEDVYPGTKSEDAYATAVAVLAICSSPAFHAVPVPGLRARRLVHRAAMAAIDVGAVVREEAPPKHPAPVASEIPAWSKPASRRERLVESAIERFGTHGYGLTRMEDIGADAGITGPGIYEHFPSKAELLIAAVGRGAELSALTLRGALAGTATPGEALERLVDSYVRSVLDHPMLLGLLLTEVVYLPEMDRQRLRTIQRDYVAGWAVVLEAARPELTDTEAVMLAHCVLAIVNRAARMPRIRARADVEELLVGFGTAALGADIGERADWK